MNANWNSNNYVRHEHAEQHLKPPIPPSMMCSSRVERMLSRGKCMKCDDDKCIWWATDSARMKRSGRCATALRPGSDRASEVRPLN